MNKVFFKMLLLMVLLVGSSTGWAQRLPQYYPATFENIGTVDSVSAQRDTLVVGDVLFYMTTKTKVHGLRGKNVTLGWVTPGTRIGFSANADFMTEIWVLPEGYQTGNRE